MSDIKKGLREGGIRRKAVWVGVLLVMAGCAGPRMGYVKFSEDIHSADPCIRVRAAIYAGNLCDSRAVPLLVDRLDDEDEAVRMAAHESLKQITKQDFGYRYYDLPSVRAVAVEQWRKWVACAGQKAGKTK